MPKTMKTKHLFQTACIALLSALAVGCSDKNKQIGGGAGELPPVLESVSPVLGGTNAGTVTTKLMNNADPSSTGCPSRSGLGHTLTVTIGTDPANNACYVYDAVEDRWCPQGQGVRFPDFNNHKISLRLCSGAADPVSAQTGGTAQQLLDADVLLHEIASHPPIKHLPSATLEHVHTLFDINFGTTIDPDQIDAVKVDGTLVPYNVLDGADRTAQYLLIVNPGGADAQIELTYRGVQYDCTVKIGDQPEDLFASNTRYIIPMDLKGDELVCGDVLVRAWNESNGAEVPGNLSIFVISGYENQTLDVKIAGADLFTGVLTLDATGRGALPYLTLPDYTVNIEYIQKTGHQAVPIGQPLGSTITMTVNGSTGEVISIP